MTTANIQVTKVLLKRGNTAQNNAYTGVYGELSIDMEANALRIHDGVLAGGNVVSGSGGGNTTTIYGNSNVAAYLPSDPTITSLIANAASQAGQLASTNTSITTANTNMKGYVDASISANITAIIGGAGTALDTLNELANALGNDASFSTSITNSLSALTSNAAVQAGQIAALQANVGVSNYGNSNVAAYLPTYNGNIKISNVTFSDLSVQRTAYTGQSWRTLLESNLQTKPTWLAYVPDGSKPTVDVNFGFDSGGMWFKGNANDQHAYPIRTNVSFYDTDATEIVATFDYDTVGDDHGIAIFNSATTQPFWRFGTDASRIAWQVSTATPELRGQSTSSVAGAPVLEINNTYTVRMVYDPLSETNRVTVELYQGTGTAGTLLDTRTINETLPAGAYEVGFDADQDNLSLKSYFTALTIKTLTNAVFNDIEVVNNLQVDGTVTGNLIPGANVTYSLGSQTAQWKDLWVSNNTIYINSIPLSMNEDNTLLVNNRPVVTYVNGSLNIGGNVISGSGTVQPYIELTDTPFITQSATLGTPVTITAAPTGNGALLSLTITAGPTLDVETIGIDSPGTGYVVGQRYIINYWQIGGNNDDSSIEFEVDSVGEEGELLTVINAAFVGGLAANTPATYTGVSVEYRPSVFDEVDAGLTLTRGQYNGLFNSEEEFSHNSSVSPTGTLWNSEGWGNLLGLGTRDYEIFDSFNPNQLTTLELVMWDTVNDKHYKFDITEWNNDTGAYAYTRTLVTDPNYFRKTDNGNEVDVIIADDGNGAGVGITRDGNNGIYNPYREGSWDSDVSPGGIGWNIDGWADLSDVEDRTYTNLYAAFGFGGLGNKIVGTECVIYLPDNGKYYAVKFSGWTQNNNGGGFSYTRREIDLTKLTQGITFADGTVQTTAYVDTNVVSTAPGQRRIETASGYNQVSVTQRVTNNYTGAINATTNGYELRIARTSELDAVLVPINEGTTNATFTLSFDNVTFREVWLSSVQATEYWFYYQNDLGQTTPQTEDDPVYLRVTTGGDSVAWWSKNELPGGSDNFRGAVIDYHAYTGDGTIIGTIHIVDDDGEEYITHTEVSSGSTDSMNNDLWIVTTEGTIRYGRVDGEASTLKIQWTARVFYGDELYD